MTAPAFKVIGGFLQNVVQRRNIDPARTLRGILESKNPGPPRVLGPDRVRTRQDVVVKKLAVVAYPGFPESDQRWIEAVRARHDPEASRIKVHLTLVFPAEVARESLIAHVRTVLARFKSIRFVIRRAAAFRDAIGGGSHIFLLPDEGHDEFVALHDHLYKGVLQPHLRTDMPYVPHVTVGAYKSFEECGRVAEELNLENRTVQGVVHRVDIVAVEAGTVHTTFSGHLPTERSRPATR